LLHCFARILGRVGRQRALRAPDGLAALDITCATAAVAYVVYARPWAGQP